MRSSSFRFATKPGSVLRVWTRSSLAATYSTKREALLSLNCAHSKQPSIPSHASMLDLRMLFQLYRFGTQFQLRRSPVRFAAIPLAPPRTAHYCQNDGSPLDRSRNPPLVRSRHCRAGPGAPHSEPSPAGKPNFPAAPATVHSGKNSRPNRISHHLRDHLVE